MDRSKRTADIDFDQLESKAQLQYPNNGLTPEENAFLESFTPAQRKKVVRKVDVRLIPLLALFYLFSFLDRANIGNAKIEGLMEDLNLSAVQYNTCLAIFFIPYVLFEIPSNYILSRVKRPSVYMGILITGWGVIMTLAGVVQNYGGLLAVRFFLGVFEAGFFPGAVYTVSRWYLPSETQTRIAFFYTASSLSGAFSGLLAAGISQMDGIAGQEGWRWIFLLEGIMTVLGGILAFLILPDTPALSGRWLDPEEMRYLDLRQAADPSRRAAARDRTQTKRQDFKILGAVVSDWQIYLQVLCFWGNSVANNGMKFTMPQIVKNMGFESTNAQLLTAPPYVAGAISSIVSALLADKFRWRFPFVAVPLTLVVISMAVLFGKAADVENNTGVMYFAVVLSCIGLYPLNPATSTWTLNNLAGPSKRALGVALLIAVGNCGGLIGSYVFLDNESPTYPTGFGAGFAFAGAGIFAACALEFFYKRINKQREALSEDDIRAQYSEDELGAMGDRSPLFRYSL